MRLHAEVLDEMEGEGEEGSVMASAALSPPLIGAVPTAPRLVVGYALTKKKVKSFLQPKLLQLARKNGISFVSIDESLPLSEQGPFDVILHKITSKEWQQVLEDYHEEHPEVTVLDPPNAIEHLNNRQSMLEEVADLNLSNFYGEVFAPRQLVITKDPSSIPTAVAMAGLTLPLVAKPLVVDGTSKGHELYLAYDEASLSMLHPPLVLQEFINHGGILFKVYIIGETVHVVRRFSLPDVNTYDLLNNVGVYRLPRVSCAAASADGADLDPLIAELPPRPLLEKLGRELRGRLGLRLFNIDMIRELGTKDRYYIIDINYFPGVVALLSLSFIPCYGKMPGYEHIFTDFLLSLAQSKYKNCECKVQTDSARQVSSRMTMTTDKDILVLCPCRYRVFNADTNAMEFQLAPSVDTRTRQHANFLFQLLSMDLGLSDDQAFRVHHCRCGSR
ncbi:Inositol-tetrakisphosphate 1-kinase 2 [Dichanthelium oligosanthes]|uniref:Inositol-tetrakisphosphate 1-kinase 2 n=1 Tax=Dichanthelium oligosanthes TaxID=888268 RepID=A0A1E5UYW5_9POAL|nr:Inositol-tetrakisphosphate 1-kinase 2 [Dichanthelium oligosanthes]